jgi:hypothetical protein
MNNLLKGFTPNNNGFPNRRTRRIDLQKSRKKSKMLVYGINRMITYWQTIVCKDGTIKKIEHFINVNRRKHAKTSKTT